MNVTLDCEIGTPVNLKAFTGCDVTIVASAILGSNAVRISVVGPSSTSPIPDTRPEPTAPQLAILRFIEREIAANGFPPSTREIRKAFNINSPNGVSCHLRALRSKGYIRWSPSKARTLAVIGASS